MSELPTSINPSQELAQQLIEPIYDTPKERSSIRTKLGRIFTAATLVMGVMALELSPAEASCDGTHCDAQGTLELSGGNWLSGQGVDVYANTGSAAYDSGIYNFVSEPSGQQVKSG